jgi:hypothetical protein
MSKFLRVASLASLALVVAAATVSAQGTKKFGAVAGVDFATMNGNDADGLGSHTGFVGGLYMTMPMGGSLMLEPEVLYAGLGASVDNTNINISHSYIQIPVLVRYEFNAAGGPYLLIGPSVGFSISCNESDGSASVSCSDDGLDSQTTFGGVFGIGFQKNRFGLEGRYAMDFGNAFKGIDANNAAWEILARIGFSK